MTDDPHTGEAPPRVTVLLASHDRLPLLQQAVASALAEEGPAIEVLVVDDGSGAETRRWLAEAEAAEPRLRLVLQPHAGVGAARARGVEEARGEIVVILDSDDELVPGTVARLAAELDRRPEIDLLYGHVRELHADGRSVLRRYPAFAEPHRMLRATLLSPRVPFKHSGSAFRRRAALELGSYDPGLPLKVDVDLFLKFLAAGRGVARLDGAPLAVFRLHSGSISRDRALGRRVWYRLIDRYGPRSSVARAAYKLARGLAEQAKALYEGVRG